MSAETVQILKITNQRGLHARASARFVEIAGKFEAIIRVSKDGHVVGGDSIMGLMMLAASKGTEIHVSASGPEADEALAAIKSLVDERFGEEQ